MDIKLISLLLFCIIPLSVSQGLPGTFSFVTIPSTTETGAWSEYIFVSATVVPDAVTTITISQSGGNNELTFSTNTLQFSPTIQTTSFRIKSNNFGYFQVSFVVSGTQFSPIIDTVYTFVPRSTQVSDLPNFVYFGFPSDAVKLGIKTPSTSDLTFTPTVTGNPDISFNPATITIPAGSLSAAFTFIGSKGAELTPSYSIFWTIAGAEATLYNGGNFSTAYTFDFRLRQITIPTFSGQVQVGAASTDLFFYAPQLPNGTVTITPQAPDTVFTPATVSLTAGSQTGRVSFTTQDTYSNKNTPQSVYFFLGGDNKDIYAITSPRSLVTPKRTITVNIANSLVLTNTTHMSIRITAPAVRDVTVYFYAAKLSFNVSSVSFSGNTTSQVVAVTPIGQLSTTISFRISGSDAEYYSPIPDATVTVQRGTFLGPLGWYIPTLWVGVESDKIPIRASFSPITDVTLTLSAPDVLFNPPTLTFKRGEEQQFFTITPLYTSSTTDFSTIPVSFLVSGGDHTFFTAPDPFSITVNRRTIQIRWSAHLNSTDRHLGKEYVLWATANYVASTDHVSVTPVSPYFSFKPAVLYFNSKTTRIKFSATCTGVVGLTSINYIIGGNDGGWYNQITPNTLNTLIRPLGISRAVLAPDNRVKGYLFENPTVYELANYHVYSFLLYSPVLPDKGLKITPKSNHVKFKPSSRTLKADDDDLEWTDINKIRDVNFTLPGRVIQVNFTAQPQSSGMHEVYFELSGKDAAFYDVPNHVFLNFRLQHRPKSEGGAASLVPALFLPVISLLVMLYL